MHKSLRLVDNEKVFLSRTPKVPEARWGFGLEAKKIEDTESVPQLSILETEKRVIFIYAKTLSQSAKELKCLK